MSMKRATLRTHRIIRTICSLVIIGCVVVAFCFVDFSAIFDKFNANGYIPQNGLDDIITNLRLTETGDRILRGTRAELQNADDFNASCKSHDDKTMLFGCYASNRIYVYNIEDRDLRGIREATLAHELLHAIWARMSNAERDAIKPSLQKMYDENESLRDHLKLYRSVEFYDELHSVVGSQILNNQLPDDLKAHFAKYFENQNIIATYYRGYSDTLKTIEKRLNELKEEIEKTNTAILAREEKYNHANEQLSQDTATFNSRVKNGTIGTEEYEAQRADLVQRKENLLNEYEAIREAIVDYNALVTEYNSYVVLTNKVYTSMNSKATKPSAD